jgi:hypothetical protein
MLQLSNPAPTLPRSLSPLYAFSVSFSSFFANIVQEALRHLLDIDNLYAKAEHLQDIAYKTEGKNRVIGSKGHDDTVAFIKETLEQFPDYYTVKLQGVPLLVGISANLTANNKTIEAFPVTLAPAGKVSGPLVAIPNLGCEEVSL